MTIDQLPPHASPLPYLARDQEQRYYCARCQRWWWFGGFCYFHPDQALTDHVEAPPLEAAGPPPTDADDDIDPIDVAVAVEGLAGLVTSAAALLAWLLE
jgi:hypothetical protein